MAYRPPHLRDVPARQPRQAAPREQPAGPSNTRFDAYDQAPPQRGTVRPQSNGRQHTNRSNGNGNGSNPIQSPARDLTPMRRLKDVKIDEMDMIQSISRSGGDGAEGDA